MPEEKERLSVWWYLGGWFVLGVLLALGLGSLGVPEGFQTILGLVLSFCVFWLIYQRIEKGHANVRYGAFRVLKILFYLLFLGIPLAAVLMIGSRIGLIEDRVTFKECLAWYALGLIAFFVVLLGTSIAVRQKPRDVFKKAIEPSSAEFPAASLKANEPNDEEITQRTNPKL